MIYIKLGIHLSVFTKLNNKKIVDKLDQYRMLDYVDYITVYRLVLGPDLPKVRYVTPPYYLKNRILQFVWLTIKLSFDTIKNPPKFLISYFFVPYGIVSTILAKLTRVKTISAIIGNDLLPILYSPFSKVLLKLLSFSSAVVVTGNIRKSMLLSKKSLNKTIVQAIHNTIDFSVFNIDKSIKKDIDFLFVGKLLTTKGITEFIKSIESLVKDTVHPSFSVEIIGDGPEAEMIREKLLYNKKLRNHIKLVGFVDNVEEYFRRSRFLVLPSYSEGLPAVLLEACRMECLPIITDVGDVTDVLGSEYPFLIKQGEYSHISDSIKENLTIYLRDALTISGEEYQKLIKQNKELSENFSSKKAKVHWDHLFKNIERFD